MASKSTSPTAGRLLQGLAFMLYCHHAGRLTTVHVPGNNNIMANIASRPSKATALFRAEHPVLSDHEFVSAFDSTFPLPQQQARQLVMVPVQLKSNIFETLCGKRTAPCGIATGKCGPGIANCSCSMTGAQTTPHTTLKTFSSHLLLLCGKATTAMEIASKFSLSQLRSVPSPKSMFWTDIVTPGKHPQHNIHSTCPLSDS
jgi:hypothetical protein